MIIYIKIYEKIPIFLLFSVQNSYFFLFSGTLPATWRPVKMFPIWKIQQIENSCLVQQISMYDEIMLGLSDLVF